MSTKLLLLLCIIVPQNWAQREERLLAELQLANLELEDDCEYAAIALEHSLLTNTFQEKKKALKAHGRLLEMQAINLKHYESSVPESIARNWTQLTHPGDAILNPRDWISLVDYAVSLDELTHTVTVNCDQKGGNCLYVKQGYENILETTRNVSLLKKSWIAWQSLLHFKRQRYGDVVNLIPRAAMQNDFPDVRTYWEMLVEQDGGYEVADKIWQQIKPLYNKLHQFVKTKIFKFYKIEQQKHIPAYLLGSNFGTDWNFVADIILPYPQLYNNAGSYVKHLDIQQIYKLAEELVQELSLKPLGTEFWKHSRFNMTFCENHLLSFCVQERTQLFTCPKTTWTSYLDAFEITLEAALRNQDYQSLSRDNLRFSVVDEAVKGLGPVFGIYNLRRHKIWDPELFGPSNVTVDYEIMELLLIALRFLPKLPFYLGADKWRLDLIDRGVENMDQEWWQMRKDMQGVEGVTNKETDFLADSFISSNKPHLNKFLGTVLLFHLLDNYKTDESSHVNLASSIGTDENFRTLIQEKSSTSWTELVSTYYSIYDISATPLLEFFAPLEAYLESAPLDPIFLPTTQRPQTTRGTVREELNVEKATELTSKSSEEQVKTIENLTKNSSLSTVSMYVGLAVLVGVAMGVLYVIAKKVIKSKRTNNRRFET